VRRLPAVDERDLTQPISSQLRATVFSGGDHRRLGVKPEGEHRATICVQSTWIADGNRQVEVKLLLVGQENGAHFPFKTGCRAETRTIRLSASRFLGLSRVSHCLIAVYVAARGKR